MRNGSISPINMIAYYKKVGDKMDRDHARGIRKKEPDFQFFHTAEVFAVVFILGFVWAGFFYILIGMVLHIILDLIRMAAIDQMYSREFFLANWLAKQMS